MLPALQKIREENKKKKVFAQVLNNRMMIIAHKLFKRDKYLHLGFILWKLHRDFGFTAWEIANFTGVPKKQIYKYWEKIKPILKSGALKALAKADYEGKLHINGEKLEYYLKEGHSFYNDFPAWYLKTERYKRWAKECPKRA